MLTAEWKLEDAAKIWTEEGEARGEKKATHKFVNHMHKEGFSIAEIVRASGLQEKDVKKILGLR